MKKNKRKKEIKKKSSKRNKNKKKWIVFFFNFLFYTVTISIFLGSILFAFTQTKNQNLGGYRAFGVLSNSMVSPDNTLKLGGFRAGDIIILKDIPSNEIKVGDIVTYPPSSNPTNKSTNYLTHRVVEVSNHLGSDKGTFITTQGDANRTKDMPINANQVLGKVIFRIPQIGGILAFVKENVLISLIFIVSVLGFVWVLRVYIFEKNRALTTSGKKRMKKKKKLNQGILPQKKRLNINIEKTRRKHN